MNYKCILMGCKTVLYSIDLMLLTSHYHLDTPIAVLVHLFMAVLYSREDHELVFDNRTTLSQA